MTQDGLLDVLTIKRSKTWFETNFPIMEKFWQTVLYNREHPELQVVKPKRKLKVIEKKDIPECIIVSDPEDEYLSEDEM
jgi:hypothetical protein